MKMGARLGRIFLAVIAGVALLVGCQHLRLSDSQILPSPGPETIRLATWNAHYIVVSQAEGRWGRSGWEARKKPMDATVKALGADIIAFQEMESFAGSNDDSVNLARTYLLDNNPAYRAAAIGNWRSFPSTQPIFYRHERLDVLAQGWFFFSETPDRIYSRTFNGSYPAFASWVRFRDRRGGEAFHVMNVHLDFSSAENRRRSTALIAERIAPWIEAGQNVFLAGDMNARKGSELHARLEATGLAFVPVASATFHLDLGLNLFSAIDHIAYAGAIGLAGPPVVFQRKLGKVWATDHYPLVANFEIGSRGDGDR